MRSRTGRATTRVLDRRSPGQPAAGPSRRHPRGSHRGPRRRTGDRPLALPRPALCSTALGWPGEHAGAPRLAGGIRSRSRRRSTRSAAATGVNEWGGPRPSDLGDSRRPSRRTTSDVRARAALRAAATRASPALLALAAAAETARAHVSLRRPRRVSVGLGAGSRAWPTIEAARIAGSRAVDRPPRRSGRAGHRHQRQDHDRPPARSDGARAGRVAGSDLDRPRRRGRGRRGGRRLLGPERRAHRASATAASSWRSSRSARGGILRRGLPRDARATRARRPTSPTTTSASAWHLRRRRPGRRQAGGREGGRTGGSRGPQRRRPALLERGLALDGRSPGSRSTPATRRSREHAGARRRRRRALDGRHAGALSRKPAPRGRASGRGADRGRRRGTAQRRQRARRDRCRRRTGPALTPRSSPDCAPSTARRRTNPGRAQPVGS